MDINRYILKKAVESDLLDVFQKQFIQLDLSNNEVEDIIQLAIKNLSISIIKCFVREDKITIEHLISILENNIYAFKEIISLFDKDIINYFMIYCCEKDNLEILIFFDSSDHDVQCLDNMALLTAVKHDSICVFKYFMDKYPELIQSNKLNILKSIIQNNSKNIYLFTREKRSDFYRGKYSIFTDECLVNDACLMFNSDKIYLPEILKTDFGYYKGRITKNITTKKIERTIKKLDGKSEVTTYRTPMIGMENIMLWALERDYIGIVSFIININKKNIDELEDYYEKLMFASIRFGSTKCCRFLNSFTRAIKYRYLDHLLFMSFVENKLNSDILRLFINKKEWCNYHDDSCSENCFYRYFMHLFVEEYDCICVDPKQYYNFLKFIFVELNLSSQILTETGEISELLIDSITIDEETKPKIITKIKSDEIFRYNDYLEKYGNERVLIEQIKNKKKKYTIEDWDYIFENIFPLLKIDINSKYILRDFTHIFYNNNNEDINKAFKLIDILIKYKIDFYYVLSELKFKGRFKIIGDIMKSDDTDMIPIINKINYLVQNVEYMNITDVEKITLIVQKSKCDTVHELNSDGEIIVMEDLSDCDDE